MLVIVQAVQSQFDRGVLQHGLSERSGEVVARRTRGAGPQNELSEVPSAGPRLVHAARGVGV